MKSSDVFAVRDRTGKNYTFMKKGEHGYFAVGDESDELDFTRIEAFTSPRGPLKRFWLGLLGRGDFKFLDANGRTWKVEATPEELPKFLAWASRPSDSLMRELVLNSLPGNQLHRLEQAEAVDGEYDLVIQTRVARFRGKGQTELRTENVAVLAMSDDRAVLVTEGSDAAPNLPNAVTRFPISAMTLVPSSEMSVAEASQEVKAFVASLKIKTRGRNTVCRLRTDLGHEIWLQMDTTDVEAVRRRLQQRSLAA